MRWTSCALLAVLLTTATVQVHAEQPNILFILADDVGDQAIGCYGGSSFDTTRVDELARSGMRFRHCYAMPKCHPTRTTLLTGRYPFRLGDPDWGTFPKEHEAKTVAQYLAGLGYATAVAGKWQLTLLGADPHQPRRLGFGRWSLFGWHEGPRYYQPMIWEDGDVRTDVSHRYGPDVYVDTLIAFMRKHRDGPFFAFYPMALAHDVTDDLDAPPPLGPQGHYDSYKVMVENMDKCVGRLVDALDEMGIREKTLLLFTGDNGTPKSYYYTAHAGKMRKEPITMVWNGEEVSGGKGDLTDAGTRVPLIANWQGTIAGGQVVDDLVDFSDWLPTFVDLAGGDPPAGIDGVSLAGRLRDEGPGPRRWAFASTERTHWVRTQRWKLYDDGRLFDMASTREDEHTVSVGAGSDDADAARLELQKALKSLAGSD